MTYAVWSLVYRARHHLVLHLMRRLLHVRTTVNLDGKLLQDAQALTGISERAALLRAGLVALIERESARRLARLGGTEPQLASVRRRRRGAA